MTTPPPVLGCMMSTARKAAENTLQGGRKQKRDRVTAVTDRQELSFHTRLELNDSCAAPSGAMRPPEDTAMLYDQMMGFLQGAVVFLLLTNAISALVAFYAMRTANLLADPRAPKTAIERKLDLFARKAA
jgi:hypothetical protein